MQKLEVVRRVIGPCGVIAGEYEKNPILNSIMYEVEFPDGRVNKYSYNVIAENILSQVESKGYTSLLMEEIVDLRKDKTTDLNKIDAYVVTRRGQKKI